MNGLAPKTGIRDGLPIALGYFAVSIAFGVATVGYGFPVWTPILISLTNFLLLCISFLYYVFNFTI